MRTRTGLVLAGLVGMVCLATPVKADIIDATIMDIQDQTSALWDTLEAANDTLLTRGILTGADTRPTGFGFYIEDPAGTYYRGVHVFTGGANVFTDSSYARGDEIEVMGTWGEYQGGTEILSLSGNPFGQPPLTTKLSSGNPLPGPTLVTVPDIAIGSFTSRRYQGMYLQLQNDVKVAYAPLPGAPRFTDLDEEQNNFIAVETTGAATESLMVDMYVLASPEIPVAPVGATVTFLRGIYNSLSVGNFPNHPNPMHRLMPRDNADIIAPTPPNLIAAAAINADSIWAQFDLPMLESSVEDLLNWSRNSGFNTIDAVVLQPDGQTVHIAVNSDPQVNPSVEEITVDNVKTTPGAGGATLIGPQTETFIGGITPITDLQTPESGMEYTGPNGTDDSQFLGGPPLTIRGTVTARFGGLLWIQDPAGGLRSGFQIFGPSGSMAVGDDVTVAGEAIEFFTVTEFSGTVFEINHGPGVMPDPMLVTDLPSFNKETGPAPAREDYEAILVEIRDVGVVQTGLESNEFVAVLGTEFINFPNTADTVRVDNRGSVQPGWGPIFPQVGDGFTSIIGVWEFTTQDNAPRGRIQPRDSTDFTPGDVTSASAPALKLVLRAPSPNPVSFARGAANISFTLPQKGEASVQLYDLRGRRVATLAEGKVMEAGSHTLRWNGTDTGGSRVRSGIYFVQLRLGNEVATGKLVVAE